MTGKCVVLLIEEREANVTQLVYRRTTAEESGYADEHAVTEDEDQVQMVSHCDEGCMYLTVEGQRAV